MAAVTQTVPNFLGGVSRQTDQKKLPGQVRDCLNAYPDPTFGLMKRPGFKFINTIYTPATGTDAELKDAKWFFIKRDDNEIYIGCLLDKDDPDHSTHPIRIWNKSGTELSHNITFTGNSKDYLNTTHDNYDVLTVQNTSIITNKTTICKPAAVPTGHVTGSYGTIRLLNIAYSNRYIVKVKIAGTLYGDKYTTSIKHIGGTTGLVDAARTEGNYLDIQASSQSGSGTGAKFNVIVNSSGGTIVSIKDRGTGHALNDEFTFTSAILGGGVPLVTKVLELNDDVTDEIAAQYYTINAEDNTLQNQLTTPSDEKYLTANRILKQLKAGLTATTLPANHTWEITQLDSTLEIRIKNNASYVAFELTTEDSQGNFSIESFNESVNSVAELPAQSMHGRIVKIVNSGPEDTTYWSKFVAENTTYNADGTVNVAGSGKGYWEEGLDPTVSTGLDKATMPHELFNSSPNNFEFREAAWADRTVGDNVTNAHPGFILKDETKTDTYLRSIQQCFYHNNRLGILTDDNVVMSKSADFFNFYYTSALTIIDSDPIDINCSSLRPAVLHGVVPTAQGLILFSRNQQFIMFSDAEILTPASAIIRGISNYEMDANIDPVESGTLLNFVSKTPSSTRVFSVQTRGSGESPDIFDVGKTVSGWIPQTPKNLISSPQNSLIALYGHTDPDDIGAGSRTIYIYKTYIVGEKIAMQAWVKWDLPGNIQHVSIDTDVMYAVVENTDLITDVNSPDKGQYILCSTNLTEAPEETILITSDGKSVNPYMDLYTAASNGKGAITTVTVASTAHSNRAEGVYTVVDAEGSLSGTLSDWSITVDSSGAVTQGTILNGGRGFVVNETVTIKVPDIDTSAPTAGNIVITVDAVDGVEKKVVYDSAGNFSKCYIPYADLTELNPVILISGNATQNFAGVTESGFTINPTRDSDTDGVYFKVPGKDLSSQAANVYVGYQYNYDVELPKTYFKLNPEGTLYDYTASLTIARMKFALGLSSVCSFKLKSKGYRGDLAEFTGDGSTTTYTVPFLLKEENGIKVTLDGARQASTAYTVTSNDTQSTVTFGTAPTGETTVANKTTPAQAIGITTDTWYDVQSSQDAGQYLLDDVPLVEENIFTIPIHQRSENFSMRVFSNSPFPVSLTSMMWEGQYSPRFYRRT